MVGSPFYKKWSSMSSQWVTKLTEIAYFVVPVIFIVAGIVLWEKSLKNRKTKDEQNSDGKQN